MDKKNIKTNKKRQKNYKKITKNENELFLMIYIYNSIFIFF